MRDVSTVTAPFVCIIGAPRSGTTWIQAMIGAHPLICTAQELKVFDLFTGPWERSWNELDRLQRTAGGGPRGLRQVWSDEEFRCRLSGVLEDVYGRVLATKPGATVVLDKSPSYSRWVAHIRRLAPQVKFVHVLRDGRDVAVSLRVAARRWARAWAPSTIETGALLWRATVLDALEAKVFGPEHYLEVRYEDALRDGPSTLRRAFDFIGVPATPRQTEDIHAAHTIDRMRATGGHPFALPPEFFREGRAGAWHGDLSPIERYLFDAAAGDLLTQLGYAGEDWWIERGWQRWLLPALAGGRPGRRLRHLVRRLRATAPPASVT